jgi:hypothetical protein
MHAFISKFEHGKITQNNFFYAWKQSKLVAFFLTPKTSNNA